MKTCMKSLFLGTNYKKHCEIAERFAEIVRLFCYFVVY